MRIIEPKVEILTPLDGQAILQHIEQVGRVCYKSEDKITTDSAKMFVAGLIRKGHEAVIEHFNITVKFTTDRGISHEIVRHRLASYAQESSRYCVAGDMKISCKNPHYHFTIKDLYEKMASSENGSWKRINIRNYNENTGELIYSKINEITYNGERECLLIRTRLGYEIECTGDHEILTDSGYIQAENLIIGQKIMVNGTNELYKNKDWMYLQNIKLDKTFVQISKEYGFNVSTLKKWARKHGLPKKGTGYFNKNRIPWNKGIKDKRLILALKKYHHNKGDDRSILKENTSNYRKYKKDKCEICNGIDNLEVHHIDSDRTNNYPNNLITLCESCHGSLHNKNVMVAFADEVVSVKRVGIKKVYDISMDSEFHNFVANGVIVHNCNYSKDKFENEITVVKPVDISEGTVAYTEWRMAMRMAEKAYFELLSEGCKPQTARSVLPTCLKTELVMTANLRELRHFIKLRGSTAAHPDIRILAKDLLAQLKAKIPVVFDDLEV